MNILKKPIWKNKNFVKRDYECTNIVFCVGDLCKIEQPENWESIPEEELIKSGCIKLWRQNEIEFYGFL